MKSFFKEMTDFVLTTVPFIAIFVFIIYSGTFVFFWMQEYELSNIRRIIVFIIGGIFLKVMYKEYSEKH